MKLALRWFGQLQVEQPQWEATPQTDQAAVDVKQGLVAVLEQAAQGFVRRLLADAEPQVWQTTDANGNQWWSAHDPATGRSLYNVSEREMRAWIEQRYF